MQIEIKASFVKDLKTVPKDFREKVATVICTMEHASNLEENTIVLVRFLHRKEIYRFFP